MDKKLELWNLVEKTDPSHTKPFVRTGGFKGTAIKPFWTFKRGDGGVRPLRHRLGVGEEIENKCVAGVWCSKVRLIWYIWSGVKGRDRAVGPDDDGGDGRQGSDRR